MTSLIKNFVESLDSLRLPFLLSKTIKITQSLFPSVGNDEGMHFIFGLKILIIINFLSTNKQYVKIKLMQNETNRWSIFFGKDEILVKL